MAGAEAPVARTAPETAAAVASLASLRMWILQFSLETVSATTRRRLPGFQIAVALGAWPERQAVSAGPVLSQPSVSSSARYELWFDRKSAAGRSASTLLQTVTSTMTIGVARNAPA